MIEVHFPITADTELKKWQRCCCLTEALRILHNRIGSWYTDGMTLLQYSELPEILKNKYPYAEFLDESSWRNFVSWHHEAMLAIHTCAEMYGQMSFSTTEESDVMSAEMELAKANWVDVNIDSELLEV